MKPSGMEALGTAGMEANTIQCRGGRTAGMLRGEMVLLWGWRQYVLYEILVRLNRRCGVSTSVKTYVLRPPVLYE